MNFTRNVLTINWNAIIAFLHMDPSQNNEPDDLVHELAHMYLARRELAFQPTDVYNQKYVAAIINDRFRTDTSRDENEIESAAVTYLVLQPLGQTDLLVNMRTMRGNLSSLYYKRFGGSNPESLSHAKLDFLNALENRRVIFASKKITEFILKFIGQ